jgi:hypothetical protein
MLALRLLDFGEDFKMKNGHGGARPAPGPRPKALLYAREVAEAEGKIVAAVPELIDVLIDAAKGGDMAAARYLLDRVFGRVAEQTPALAEDRRLPYTEEDMKDDLDSRESNRRMQRMFTAP